MRLNYRSRFVGLNLIVAKWAARELSRLEAFAKINHVVHFRLPFGFVDLALAAQALNNLPTGPRFVPITSNGGMLCHAYQVIAALTTASLVFALMPPSAWRLRLCAAHRLRPEICLCWQPVQRDNRRCAVFSEYTSAAAHRRSGKSSRSPTTSHRIARSVLAPGACAHHPCRRESS